LELDPVDRDEFLDRRNTNRRLHIVHTQYTLEHPLGRDVAMIVTWGPHDSRH
jgi:hypothetical protein